MTAAASPATTLPGKLLCLHAALDAAGLPHAFGGAIALAYCTQDPRGTRDIDVNVFVPASTPQPVLDALPAAVTVPEGTGAALIDDGQVRLWWDDTPVDLFLDYAPLHEQAARGRRTVPFAGAQIPVLGALELVLFKALFDRPKDWVDIAAVVAAQAVDPRVAVAGLHALVGPQDHRIRRLHDLAG